MMKHAVDEACEVVQSLRADKERLQAEIEALHGLLRQNR